MSLADLAFLLLTLAVLAWVAVRVRNDLRPKPPAGGEGPVSDDINALIEHVTPLLRANPGLALKPSDLMVAGLTLDQAKTVCAALRFQPDLAQVDLGVLLDGKPTGAVISMDFNVSPSTIDPSVKTWHDPRLRFVWRVIPNGAHNTNSIGG